MIVFYDSASVLSYVQSISVEMLRTAERGVFVDYV